MAAQHPTNPYSLAHEVQADGSVTFKCSQDVSANPWLALPPHHAVVVQTQSFWTAVGASTAANGWEETKWTALTWIDWELGDGTGGHAVRGVYRRDETGENLGYSIALYNEAGLRVVTIRGRGVVFRNRNFEAWRKAAKDEAKSAAPLESFAYASDAALGLTQDERAMVAPFTKDSGFVDALVTAQNGFPPGNPVIGGSGDHVNSTHLHELARQALFLVKERNDIETSGTMELNRYVELGAPLRMNIAADEARRLVFKVEQVGKPCATITLRW